MIQRIVDSALRKRLFVIALAVVLFVWGMVAFQALPVEAYPDVANNYVQVITQWPGRAAEEVEQQVTIPIEIVMMSSASISCCATSRRRATRARPSPTSACWPRAASASRWLSSARSK